MLDVDAAAKKLLASEGYDPQFGARPLKRAVQACLAGAGGGGNTFSTRFPCACWKVT
jgi:hypothetical protein